MRKYNPKNSKVVIENGRVYTVSEKVEAPVSDLEIFEKMSDKDKKKRLDMIRKAVEKIDKKNMAKAKKDALAMMKSSGMFDEAIEETEEVTEDLSEAKEFDRVKEVNAVKKIDKLLENAYKGMGKLQYGRSTYMMEVNDGIVMARRSLNTYKLMAAGGDLDGPLQK